MPSKGWQTVVFKCVWGQDEKGGLYSMLMFVHFRTKLTMVMATHDIKEKTLGKGESSMSKWGVEVVVIVTNF